MLQQLTLDSLTNFARGGFWFQAEEEGSMDSFWVKIKGSLDSQFGWRPCPFGFPLKEYPWHLPMLGFQANNYTQ